MAETLTAGVGMVDITPADSQFLYGYPHVERYRTDVYVSETNAMNIVPNWDKGY